MDAPEASALREGLEAATLLLSPFAPHLAEECWSLLGREGLVACERWPEADPSMLESREVTVVVQVNGKLRGRINVPPGAGEEAVLEAARADEKVAPHLSGSIARTVYVPDKLLNVVVRGGA